MDFSVNIGLSFTATTVVDRTNIASKYGSGLIDVFATPAMVALMENASFNAVQPYLPQGYNTVGIEVCVKHTKATPMGMKISCKSTLIEVDGKRLVFEVVATDEVAEIGRGTHTRYIIDTEKFMNKIGTSSR